MITNVLESTVKGDHSQFLFDYLLCLNFMKISCRSINLKKSANKCVKLNVTDPDHKHLPVYMYRSTVIYLFKNKYQ